MSTEGFRKMPERVSAQGECPDGVNDPSGIGVPQYGSLEP
jgi:hypothetical protein